MRCYTGILGGLSILTAALAASDPIVIKGSKFFHSSSGTQFYVKGIYYTESSWGRSTISDIDPLTTSFACERDIPIFRELGINTIALSSVDASASHDHCMNLLNDAGIYVIALLNGVNTVKGNFSGAPSWGTEDFAEKSVIVDALAKYDNVVAFVYYEALNTTHDPYSKALLRDLKSHMVSKKYRHIPVGYGILAPNIPVPDYLDYFRCGSEEVVADFFAMKTYGWCGASQEDMGWNWLTEDFAVHEAPVIMGEYGCASSPDRSEPAFEVETLFGNNMSRVWSGGLLYTYAGAPAGLVNVSNEAVTKGPLFTTYSSAFAQASPTSVNSASYTPTNTALPDCPPTDLLVASPILPPEPDEQFCACTLRHSLCTPAGNLDDEGIDALFTALCDRSTELCGMHTSNSTTGVYGAYSMCNATVEAAALLSNYTQQERGDQPDACTQVWTSGVIANIDYAPTGTCTTIPIRERNQDGDSAGDDDNNSDTNSGRRLSAGAIAGIVVGAVAAITLAIVAIIFLRRRRRTRHSLTKPELVEPVELPPGKPYDRSELPSGDSTAELEGERPELDSEDSERTPVELSGEERRVM
ncbi:Glucanosyltransferase-domain-containing protein [Aspergillus karnatakaensis]|uniref:Glucanosyltransferase-domain-containing protein n=1 Tax=Aspergillus karnatakaensis TaxID=1810916 RepID=UPI003CCE07AA